MGIQAQTDTPQPIENLIHNLKLSTPENNSSQSQPEEEDKIIDIISEKINTIKAESLIYILKIIMKL
jgi:hypothetical protein